MVRDILLPKIKALFGEMRGELFTMTESPPYDVKVINGAEIWLRSAEVREGLYGPDLARGAMDEVTLGNQEDSYTILLGRIRQPGFPNQLLVTGTPKGRNWVWRRYVSDPDEGVDVFTARTEDNQHLREGYVEELTRAYGGADAPLARQELGGDWVQMAGQVFEQFSRDIHIRHPDDWKLLKDKIGGIDFGAISPTALIACGVGTGERLHAYREWYKHEATLDQTVEAMAGMEAHWGVTRWIADPSGRREMDALRRLGFHVEPARHGNKIALRVQLMGARLNVGPDKLPGMFISPDCPNLIREVEALTWRRERLSGRMEEVMNDAFDPSCDDHAIDAATNVVSAYDASSAPWKQPKEPLVLYQR